MNDQATFELRAEINRQLTSLPTFDDYAQLRDQITGVQNALERLELRVEHAIASFCKDPA